MRLIIVRHGEPNYQKDCLTPLGEEQAVIAAQRLKDEGITDIYSSPMGRALATARPTAELLGIRDIRILDFIHEINWDNLTDKPLHADGHPWTTADDMVRDGWNLASPGWEEHPFWAGNNAVNCAKYVEKEGDKWLASLGYRREGAHYVNECSMPDHRNIAIFCHDGSSSAFIAHMLNLPFPYVCTVFHLTFTGITILTFDPEPGSIFLPGIEIACDGRHLPKQASATPVKWR
ncbi:MAG: phosphoglycerate mutase family protein [Lachnospiraceae bacterium]|nr:phosphoglycerate mutase family protein [Lachnospiraceae bacterium]